MRKQSSAACGKGQYGINVYEHITGGVLLFVILDSISCTLDMC